MPSSDTVEIDLQGSSFGPTCDYSAKLTGGIEAEQFATLVPSTMDPDVVETLRLDLSLMAGNWTADVTYLMESQEASIPGAQK